MAKRYGTGELITANDLKIDDVYVTNTKAKLRFTVFSTEVTDEAIKTLTDNGEFLYEMDRPLILVQRDGSPVPFTE